MKDRIHEGRRHHGPWPFVAIGLAVVIFGNTFPAVKVCLRALGEVGVDHPALAFLPMRFVPAALIYAALVLVAMRREAVALLRAHPWRVILAGLLVVLCYNVTFNLGLGEINPGVSALIIALNPIMTLLLSMPLLGERVRPRQLTGIIVAFMGIFIVVRWGQGHEVTTAMIQGSLITVLAPASWALYTITVKPLVGRHSALVVTALAVMIGTLPVLVFARPAALEALPGAPPRLWASWAFVSLGATVLAFWLYTVPLRVLTPTALSIFIYLIPLVAVASSIVLWRQEPFTWGIALGGAVVIAGVALANERLWRGNQTRNSELRLGPRPPLT